MYYVRDTPYTTPVSESALRYDKKVPQGNFFRSYTISRAADLLVHTADLLPVYNLLPVSRCTSILCIESHTFYYRLLLLNLCRTGVVLKYDTIRVVLGRLYLRVVGSCSRKLP